MKLEKDKQAAALLESALEAKEKKGRVKGMTLSL